LIVYADKNNLEYVLKKQSHQCAEHYFERH